MDSTLLLVGASAAFKWLAFYGLHKTQAKVVEEKEIGNVLSISLFPVKSFKGIRLQNALCTKSGLFVDGVHDRSWMVAFGGEHRMVTARQEPSLLLIQTSIHGNYLHLEAPGMPVLKLPIDQYEPPKDSIVLTKVWGEEIEAVDCGSEASAWVNKYLNKDEYHLLRSLRVLKQRVLVNGTAAPDYQRTAAPDDEVAFPDLSPYHLLTEGSVMDLNSRISEPVCADNFRPNILVSGPMPYDEDKWKTISIGSAKFRCFKLCDRCLLTTIDPETGIKREDNEPLETLRSYRLIVPEFKKSPCFGTNAVLTKQGSISVGDKVMVSY